MPLSTAAKVALCVCPPALLAGTAATVPAVRKAVHHVTAPRHAAGPVRHVARGPAQAPAVAQRRADCDPVAGGVVPAVPLVTYADPIPDEPGADRIGTTGAIGAGVPVIGAIGIGGGGGGGGSTPIGPSDPGAGPVPEPSIWLMMIAGVGTLGAALRRRRGTGDRGTGSRGAIRKATAGGALWSGSAAVEAGDMAATLTMKSAVAGAAGKAAMLCVCPAAIVAGTVMAVPPVRQAVHAATLTPAVAPIVVAGPQAALPCPEMTVPVAATAVEGFPATVATAAPTPGQAATAPVAAAVAPAAPATAAIAPAAEPKAG